MRLSSIISTLCFATAVFCAILGVDYGQEFIKSALIGPNVRSEIVLTPDSKRKEVAGIAIRPGKPEVERFYGSGAVSLMARFPESCSFYLKRFLGNPDHSILDFGKAGNFSIQETIAMTFSDIRQRAESHLQSAMRSKTPVPVDQIVLTVPGFFSQAQKQVLSDAAEVAGMRVLNLLDDGTAVALNYISSRVFDNTEKQYHVIYDMGAGSTKVTLFSVRKGAKDPILEVENFAYDETLGGHLLTDSVSEIITQKFLAQHNRLRSHDLDAKSKNKLWLAAEKAKMILSANQDASVSIESLYKSIDFKCKVSREEYEEYNQDIMPRLVRPVQDVLHSVEKVESVIVTGGATRTPFVQKHLASLVGDDVISKNVNADESAVQGALIGGVIKSGQFKAKNIDIVEHSFFDYDVRYYVQDEPETVNVFPQGSVLGVTASRIVELNVTTSQAFNIDLYENGELFQQNVISASECENGSQISATFTLNDNKIFSLQKVSAKCKRGVMEKLKDPLETDAKATSLSFESHNTVPPLSREDKFTSSLRLRHLANQDKERREIDEVKNQLEASVYDLRNYISQSSVFEKCSQLYIDEASNKVSEFLEWLDYDCDDSSYDEFSAKLREISKLKQKIEAFISLSNLDAGVLSEVRDKGLDAVNTLQSFMLQMSEDASTLYQNFTDFGLDFQKESAKIKIKGVETVDEKEMQLLFDQLNQKFKLIVEMVENPKEFSKWTKERLFELYEDITEKTLRLGQIQSLLKGVHNERIESLQKVLTKHIRAKLRERRKAEMASSSLSASAESATETSTESYTESFTTETSPTENSTQTESSETSTADSQAHDEL